MPRNNTALGTTHESSIREWLKARGYLYAKRKPKAGGKDEGDLTLGDGHPVLIEAKTYKVKTSDPIRLGVYMAELEEEIANAAKDGIETGFVVAKRRGSTDVGQYFAITSVERMMELVERAYGAPPKRRLRLVRKRR